MTRANDDLETYLAERAAQDPELPARVDATLRRRELQRAQEQHGHSPEQPDD